MRDERDQATQIRDEDVRQAFPPLEPFVAFPTCAMCGAKHVMLASWLERKHIIRKGHRLGAFGTIYCPGNQQKPAPCAGIPEPHQHICCVSCQYVWLTVTYEQQQSSEAIRRTRK
jgi:hypothetical protein